MEKADVDRSRSGEPRFPVNNREKTGRATVTRVSCATEWLLFFIVIQPSTRASQGRNNVRPNGDHADKKCERRKGDGFLNEGRHGKYSSLERKRNIVHEMF